MLLISIWLFKEFKIIRHSFTIAFIPLFLKTCINLLFNSKAIKYFQFDSSSIFFFLLLEQCRYIISKLCFKICCSRTLVYVIVIVIVFVYMCSWLWLLYATYSISIVQFQYKKQYLWSWTAITNKIDARHTNADDANRRTNNNDKNDNDNDNDKQNQRNKNYRRNIVAKVWPFNRDKLRMTDKMHYFLISTVQCLPQKSSFCWCSCRRRYGCCLLLLLLSTIYWRVSASEMRHWFQNSHSIFVQLFKSEFSKFIAPKVNVKTDWQRCFLGLKLFDKYINAYVPRIKVSLTIVQTFIRMWMWMCVCTSLYASNALWCAVGDLTFHLISQVKISLHPSAPSSFDSTLSCIHSLYLRFLNFPGRK